MFFNLFSSYTVVEICVAGNLSFSEKKTLYMDSKIAKIWLHHNTNRITKVSICKIDPLRWDYTQTKVQSLNIPSSLVFDLIRKVEQGKYQEASELIQTHTSPRNQ